MRVLIDDAQSNIDADTVGEAIAAAAGLAEKSGRMIVEVIVDGVHWTETQITSAEFISRDAEEVQLLSDDPRRLVQQTFEDAGEALSRCDALQREAAELIQSNQMDQAMQRLGEAMDIWQSVQGAVEQGSALLNIELGALSVDGVEASAVLGQLNEQLLAVRDALKGSDPVGLSDTLLYVLPDVIELWRGLLDVLARTAAPDNEGA